MEQKKDKRDIERGHCTYTYIYNILGNKWTFQSFETAKKKVHKTTRV